MKLSLKLRFDKRRFNMKDKTKLFISHAGADKKYIELLITLIESIGVGEDVIFCSSIPGYGVPLNYNIYDYLKDEFLNNKLIVIFALSDNYYKSAACLNEMGAAWVLKKEYVVVLMPEFKYRKIDGAIDPRKTGVKLGGDLADLKHKLGELRNLLVEAFSLHGVSEAKWERYRDIFICKVQQLVDEN